MIETVEVVAIQPIAEVVVPVLQLTAIEATARSATIDAIMTSRKKNTVLREKVSGRYVWMTGRTIATEIGNVIAAVACIVILIVVKDDEVETVAMTLKRKKIIRTMVPVVVQNLVKQLDERLAPTRVAVMPTMIGRVTVVVVLGMAETPQEDRWIGIVMVATARKILVMERVENEDPLWMIVKWTCPEPFRMPLLYKFRQICRICADSSPLPSLVNVVSSSVTSDVTRAVPISFSLYTHYI
jgi:hypothetical protein